MTDHQTEAERHMERLVSIAIDPALSTNYLSVYDCWQIKVARVEMASLMLSLAVLLDSGGSPSA